MKTYPDDINDPELLADAAAQLRQDFPKLTDTDVSNLCGMRAAHILDKQRGGHGVAAHHVDWRTTD